MENPLVKPKRYSWGGEIREHNSSLIVLFLGEFCQPLGDQNVWGTLYPITDPLKEPEVVMLATKVQGINFTPSHIMFSCLYVYVRGTFTTNVM